MPASTATAALLSLALIPFGDPSAHLQGDRPWFGFDAQGAVLTLVRAQKAASGTCAAWQEALIGVRGMAPAPKPGEAWTAEPLRVALEWSGKSLEKVKDCDGFPCDVKLDRLETTEMKKTPKEARLDKYLSLIASRVERYRHTEERKEYEIPGKPVDEWKWLDEHGFRSEAKRPSAPALFLRQLRFNSDRTLPLHQVLDRRWAKSPDGREATVWIRDAYTDHYFDGWGEWDSVFCDPSTKEVAVVQAIVGEMDFLKESGLAVALFSGKFKSGFEQGGHDYLNNQFDELSKDVSRLGSAQARIQSRLGSAQARIQSRLGSAQARIQSMSHPAG